MYSLPPRVQKSKGRPCVSRTGQQLKPPQGTHSVRRACSWRGLLHSSGAMIPPIQCNSWSIWGGLWGTILRVPPVELPLPAQAYSDAKDTTAQGQQGGRLRRRSPRHEVLRLSVCPACLVVDIRLPDGHTRKHTRVQVLSGRRIEQALRSRRQRLAVISQPPDGSLIIGVAAVASVLEQPSLHLSDCRAKSDFVMLSRGDCSLSMKAAFLGIR